MQALFDKRCINCHGKAQGLKLSGDFTTDTVGVNSAEVPKMKLILAGSKDKSYLFHKIAGTHLGAAVGGSGGRMPLNAAALSALEIDRIGKYIDGL